MPSTFNIDTFNHLFRHEPYAAVSALFQEFSRDLTVFAFGLTGNEIIAEDITIKAISRLYELLLQGRTDLRNIKNYLFLFVRREGNSIILQTQKSRLDLASLPLAGGSLTLAGPGAPVGIVSNILSVLKDLPDPQREAVILLYAQHLAPQEAAERMNISIPEMRRHLQQALFKVRESLLKHGISIPMLIMKVLIASAEF